MFNLDLVIFSSCQFLAVLVHTKHARGYQNVFISPFVQLEDVMSKLDIINKKSYKTARGFFTHRLPLITKTTVVMTEIIKHILRSEEKAHGPFLSG